MKIWDDIRNYFYKRTLAQRLSALSIKRHLINLNDAKSVGILYDSSVAGNDVAVAVFAENLRNMGKTVDILGFVSDKKIESKPGIQIFNKKNLNWARVPEGEAVEKFANQNFDLLVTGFTGEDLPLEFIARISHALCRVGEYAARKTDCYELMVNTAGKNDLNYLFEQSIYFLNQIKYDSK